MNQGTETRGTSPASPGEPQQRTSELERRKLVITHLRSIANAFEKYRQHNEAYPPTSIAGRLSWRVQLLPFLGHVDLYRKFNLGEPWDGPTNRPLLDQIPDVFRSPERLDTSTCYQLITGGGTAFADPEGLSTENCRDGVEHTVLLIEVHRDLAKPWTAPQDYAFEKSTVQHDWFGMHGDCGFGVFGGAAGVRRLSATIPDAQLLALISPQGGESVRYQDATTYAHPDVDVTLQEQLAKEPFRRFQATSIASNEPAATATDRSAPGQGTTGSGASPDTGAGGSRAASGSPSSSTNGAGSQAASPDSRRELPSDEQVEAATATVRELYANEYKHAKQIKERRDFARRLLDDVERIEGDVAGRYVLLKAARDIAAKAGDLTTAMGACDKLGTEFRVDLLSMKLKVLEQAVTNVQNESELDPLLDHGLKLGDEALKLDDFNSARSAYQIALSAARRKRNPSAEKQVGQRDAKLRDTKLAYMRITDHVHTLVRSPDDPTANTAVGKYFALMKQDWERGLPMLTRGTDARLKTVALADLSAPADADAKVGIGDQWWEIAEEASTSSEKEAAKTRALYWYELAQPQLGASLQKIRVERRINETKRLTRADLNRSPEPLD